VSNRLSAWAPGTATVLFSGIVGLATFVGVLLYGPEPTPPAREPLTGLDARTYVRADAIENIRRGRDERVIQNLTTHLSEDPGFGWAWRVLHQVAQRDERYSVERIHARQRLLDLSRDDWRDRQWNWDGRTEVLRLMLAGKPGEAGDAAADMVNELDTLQSFMNGATRWYLSGAVLAVAGRTDEALDALERAVDEGYRESRWLRRSPDLDSLRGHPRFEALVERVRALNRADAEADAPDEPAVPDNEAGDEADGDG